MLASSCISVSRRRGRRLQCTASAGASCAAVTSPARVTSALSLAGCIVCGSLACGGVEGQGSLSEPSVGHPGPRPSAFLSLPPEASAAPELEGGVPSVPGFPLLLSETGAFTDVASLTAAPGLVPYEIQAPLWSDGTAKRRWIAVPEGTQLGYSPDAAWRLPEGTVFVKHFEMALDERNPDERRRLETRLWVVGARGSFYGVSYRWNDAQTDAELFVDSSTEELSLIDAAGEPYTQLYDYPGARDCVACHNEPASHVLGIRAWQLNLPFQYRAEAPAINQLVAWSGWGLLDVSIDNTEAELTTRLAALDDESASLEHRVRSYWDGNCAMCHRGSEGSVPGWDARISTPLSEQGVDAEPVNSLSTASHLIAPGAPGQSLIYQRGDTVDRAQRMPPLGRNRVDSAYIEVLTRWIDSL